VLTGSAGSAKPTRMLSSKPLILHLICEARAKLLAVKPELHLPVLRSEAWLKRLDGAYKEIETPRPLNSAQMEETDRLRMYFLLLDSRLVTLPRIAHLLKLFSSSVRHRSSGKKRSERNSRMITARNRWLRECAKALLADNPRQSISAIATRLAKDIAAFKKRNFEAVGPESIRRIIRRQRI
jgi:hypothetical protein